MLQETWSGLGIGRLKPLAPHKVADNPYVPPLTPSGRVSQGCPHRLIGSIISPGDSTLQATRGKEGAGILQVLPSRRESFS